MPRIPVRVEPYSSPSRQHRHYKNKRDQVLRALGKAAYINGSHFAIMWVSARGDVETYASEALQTRLDDWFVKGGIADEARQLVKNSARPGAPASTDVQVFEDSDDEVDEPQEGEDANVFLDTSASQHDAESCHAKAKPKRGALAPLNTTIANQSFLRSRASWPTQPWSQDDQLAAPKSAPLFPCSTLATFAQSRRNENNAPRTSTPIVSASARMLSRNSISTCSASTSSLQGSPPTVEITLANAAARTAFLELRFGQLQQGVCKTVAKAWIKIIEPKKQTRCPYNKGEAGKPDWWPEGVRHKEPDHLMKPERHLLLLTILRSPKVKVARLQLATAEVVALIKADKVSLLMDVYRIAREEEKLRESGGDAQAEPISVGVSTLDGWCKEGSEMTSHGRQIARSATPEASAGAASSLACNVAGGDKRKRITGAAGSSRMVKSHSTGAVGAGPPHKKRRSIATSTLSAQVRTEPLARSTPTTHAMMDGAMFDATAHQQNHLIGLGLVDPVASNAGAMGMARSHSFSAPSAPYHHTSNEAPMQRALGQASSSAETSPWPHTYALASSTASTEVNGLATPLTATSAIDAGFATATHPAHPTFFYTQAANFSYPAPHAHAHSQAHAEMCQLTSAINTLPFQANALGLDNWALANFDLHDLSSSSWNAPHSGTDESFSFDTSMGSAATGADSAHVGARTPSPGPALRLDIPTKPASDTAEAHHIAPPCAPHDHHTYWLHHTSQRQQPHA